MWKYEKKLEYPVNIKKKDVKMAKYLLTQYGGPEGELRASMRYLNQRYMMPTNEAKALLTEIGTEELSHMEIICIMIYQLTKDATIEELEKGGLLGNYVEFGSPIFPVDINGVALNTYGLGTNADYESILADDMAAEERARVTYEALMKLTDDPDVLGPLSFLREREIVHFQRFGELLMNLRKNTSK